MSENVVYHASNIPNLTVLEPCASTHGTPYVYALESRAMALVFGARQDDFDFNIDEKCGKLVLSECYPGAFEKIYSGKSCSVYTLAADGFERGRTGWDAELVCPRAVDVLAEERVGDLFAELSALRRGGALEVVEYRDEPDYRRFVAGHIVDRMVRFGVLESDGAKPCYADRDERFRTHFRRIADALKKAVDGSLLE